MASCQQSRIEAYLEKNKIGPLFEEMMTRLISETPDHPVPFLINHLEGRQGGSASLHRVLLGPAALWAQSPSAGARRDLKGHEKPWQEHPRKPKKSKSDLEMCTLSPPSPDSKSQRPSQDSWSRSDSHDFDELSHILLESKKLGKALESLSRSKCGERAFNSALQRPRVIGRWTGRADSDADPLASEMLHPPLPRGYRETSEPIVSLKMVTKSRSLKQQQLYHKKQLAAMLAQESFDSTGSLYVSDSDIDDEDEAMELMEDLDDLRMEGVTNLMPSRTKASHGRGSHSPQPQAKLTLNICSRCARCTLCPVLTQRQSSQNGLWGILSPRRPRVPCKSWTPTPRSHAAPLQAEFYQQLQAMKQPWILPSDTESEDGMTGPGPA
uniref:Chromosome 8 open reading frame 34 n=1 Tax=Paramormyrops kingsleyae TaxID=1676925 RepID=A0A3B3TFN8_9TELE